MRERSVRAFAFSLLLMTPTVASAGGTTIGFDLGIPVPTGDLDEAFNGDFALMGYGAGPLMGPLAWRGEVAYTKMSEEIIESLCPGCELDLELTSFSGGIQFGGLGGTDRRAMPYGFFTLGAYRTTSSVKIPDVVEESESDTFFGVGFGGGLDIRLGETWGVQGDLHVHAVRFTGEGESEWETFLTPSGGIWLSF